MVDIVKIQIRKRRVRGWPEWRVTQVTAGAAFRCTMTFQNSREADRYAKALSRQLGAKLETVDE